MKIFVTGGTGYIGLHLVKELLQGGHQVTVLTRDPENLGPMLTQVTPVPGHLEDIERAREHLPDHDALIHNAIIWNRGTEHDFPDTRAADVLFESAADAGIRHLIYTSSTAVHRPFQAFMDEETPLAPADLYGATKLAGETSIRRCAADFTIDATVLRVGPTCGPPALDRGRANTDRRFNQIADAALQGQPISIARHEARQFISAPDLAVVFRAVVETRCGQGVLLVVARDHVSWQEIAEAMVDEARTGSTISVVNGGCHVKPPHFSTSRLRKQLGLSFTCRERVLDHARWAVQKRRTSANVS